MKRRSGAGGAKEEGVTNGTAHNDGILKSSPVGIWFQPHNGVTTGSERGITQAFLLLY